MSQKGRMNAGQNQDITQHLLHAALAFRSRDVLVDLDVLVVSWADKLHNARAIYSDLRVIGPVAFDRFKSGHDGTLWYHAALSDCFSQLLPGTVAAKLAQALSEMRALSAMT